MERGRSFSGGWKHSRPPRIATVKPVSKSLSEDDLIKCVEGRNCISPRVIDRLKVQDLTALKKDNLISELEKCLGELEEEHDTTNKLVEVYGKVETERNELLDELDVAFQDLQEYMRKQKEMEEQNTVIESDRDELIRENEYLKAVLSNRTEIRDNKLDEENRMLSERSKDLEIKNTQLLDEINDLYEERQTLITSLLNLRSNEVDDVIRRSRSSSLASRDSSSDVDRLKLLNEGINDQVKEIEVFFDDEPDGMHETCRKTISELNAERLELKEAFKRVKKERDSTEKELDGSREEKEKLEKIYADKMHEVDQLIEERNEKNLNISELKLEKRTFQRQLDHMRETQRATAAKMESLLEENEDLRASLKVMSYQIDQERDEDLQIEKYLKEIENLTTLDSKNEATIAELREKIIEQGEAQNRLESSKVQPQEEEKLMMSNNDSKHEELRDLLEQLREKKVLLEEQTNALEELRSNNKQLQANVDKLRDTNRELEGNNDELQVANKELRAKSDELRASNEEIERLLQQVTKERDAANGEKEELLKELRASNDELSQRLQRMTSEKDEFSVRQDTALKEITEQLSQAKAKHKQMCDEFQTRCDALNEQCQRVTKEKEVANDKYEQLSTELKSRDGKVQQALEESRSQLNEVARLEKMLEASQKENKETRDGMLVLRKEKDEIATECDRLKIKLQQEGTKYNKVDLENADLKCQIGKLSNNAELSDKQSKNRINTLEIEITKVTTAKETLEKLLKRKELDLRTLKNENIDLATKLEYAKKEINAKDERAAEEKVDGLKAENLKLSQKCQQLGKLVTKHSEEFKTLKQTIESMTQKNQNLEVEVSNSRNNFNTIKIENERLTKKMRQLERNDRSDQLTLEIVSLKNGNKELQADNDALTQRLCFLETNGQPPLTKSINDEREKYTTLLLKYDEAAQKIENLTNDLKKSADEKKKFEEIIQKLKEEKQKMERDVQYILQSRKEEAETVFSNKRNEIEHERDTIKAKYELQRVACDKMNKERDHYIMTINTLREENGKLHEQIRKQRLISSSTQDLMIQRLRDENESLEKQIETLQQTLTKCLNENKELTGRLEKHDDNTLTTIRSLKARKNELQLRVSTLSHEKEQLLKQLETKTDSSKSSSDSKLNELEVSESNLKEQLMHAHAKIAELELDNTDYGKKLQESESLMFDLQKALAQANDLAMQKSLESTKFRRQMELKNDHLVKENTELKRKIYFAGKSNGEISPTSLFPKSLPNAFDDQTDGFKNRKASLPVGSASTMQRPSKRVSSARDNVSFEYPLLEPMPEVKNSRYSTQSSQVEQDLSQQLRELLDLSNDLTKTDDEYSKVSSDESTAPPPVPPPPRNYETLDRKKSLGPRSSNEDTKKDEDWV